MRLAVIVDNEDREYIWNNINNKKDFTISYFMEITMKMNQGSFHEVPQISLDKLKKIYKVEVDGVFIAIRRNHYVENIIEKLHDEGINNVYVLKLYALEKREAFLDENRFIDSKIYRLDSSQPWLVHLETHIVDNCNMNCKACNNFSSLVREKRNLSPQVFEKDLLQTRVLFGGIMRLFLLGGEPLLEPNLACEFINISRKIYPHTEIRLLTNGTLIPKMTEEFWKCILENDIIIHITVYPPTLKILNQIYDILYNYNVKFIIFREVKTFAKRWTKYPFEDPVLSNEKCFSAGCHFLRNGCITKCPDSILIENFDKEFGTSLRTNDEISIYDCNNPWDMLRKLNAPIDLCSYCAPHREVHIQWERLLDTPNESNWLIDHKYEYNEKILIKNNQDHINELNNINKKLLTEKETINKENEELNRHIMTIEQELAQKQNIINENSILLKEQDAVIKQKDTVIKQKDAVIKQKDAVIKQKDIDINEKDNDIKEKDIDIKRKESIIEKQDTVIKETEKYKALYTAISTSTLWKATSPIRKLFGKVRK